MSKRKTASAVFTGVAATGLTGLTGFAAGPALAAASTWSVKNGGHYTAKNTTGPNVLTDITKNTTLTVPTSHATGSGNVPNVASTPGTSIGTVTRFSPGTSAAPFSGPLGTKFKGHATSTPWYINAVSQSPSGLVHASITGFQVHFTGTNNSCSWTEKGTATGTYSNGTGVLNVTNAGTVLTVTKATAGCLGIFASGDRATFQGPIKIITPTPAPQLHHNTA